MTALEPIEIGPLTLFGSASPREIVAQATAIADEIAPLIRARHLSKRIGPSEHVYLEAWTLAGTMLGVFATTVRTWEVGDGGGYGACVEARTITGSVVGRAEAIVTRDESNWADKDAFQLLSMAQTRASSKALRMPLGFVMKLAGYDTTPAEEMEAAAARGETVTGGKDVAPGWDSKAEQNRAHRELYNAIGEAGLQDWATQWLDDKSYRSPLAKAQLRQFQRAFERERQSGRPGGEDAAPARPAGAKTSGAAVPPKAHAAPDQTSDPGRADHRTREAGIKEPATTPGSDQPTLQGGEDP